MCRKVLNIMALKLVLILSIGLSLMGFFKVSALDLKKLVSFFGSTEGRGKPENFKMTSQRITDHGYPVEIHNITTNDGYTITIYRIPYSPNLKNQFQIRPIVLLQHGLFGSSDSWVLLGHNDGLPFLLSDAGYDVWLGNSRGIFYARKHENISQFSTDFWQFSWHEIGHFDLPAIIDYALKMNDAAQKSLHYIGFSQGTTACLVLLATRPEYNDKIKMAHLLAPVAYVRHLNDKLVRTLAPMLGYTSTATTPILSGQEFLPKNELFIQLSYNVCRNFMTQFVGLCTAIASLLENDLENVNRTALQYLAETHPAGCSTNQLIHYMQEHQRNCFCQFDFGALKNVAIYGQTQPPDYELKNVLAELHLWHADSDDMSTPQDVARLAEALSNRVMHHIENTKWAHGDFLLNVQVRKYVYAPLIEIIKNYDRQK